MERRNKDGLLFHVAGRNGALTRLEVHHCTLDFRGTAACAIGTALSTLGYQPTVGSLHGWPAICAMEFPEHAQEQYENWWLEHSDKAKTREEIYAEAEALWEARWL